MDLDRFGHALLGGVSAVLCDLIASELKLKARFDKPGTIQRVSGLLASPVDVEEAYRVGREAVRRAVAGSSGYMVTIVRQPGPAYRSTLGLASLERVANGVRTVPDAFIAPGGNDVTPAYLDYIRPLIGPPLPPYARLARVAVPARLG